MRYSTDIFTNKPFFSFWTLFWLTFNSIPITLNWPTLIPYLFNFLSVRLGSSKPKLVTSFTQLTHSLLLIICYCIKTNLICHLDYEKGSKESLNGWVYIEFSISTLKDIKLTFETHVLYLHAPQYLPVPWHGITNEEEQHVPTAGQKLIESHWLQPQ